MASVAFALGILVPSPTPLLADALMPWVFLTVPMMVLGLIPIIFIEALVLRSRLTLGWWRALKVSTIANLTSTFVGVVGLMGLQSTPWGEVGNERNAVFLFVPLLFVSWLIEDPIAWRMLRLGRPGSAVPSPTPAAVGAEPPSSTPAFPAPTRARVRSGTFAANVASYLFLAAILTILLAWMQSEKAHRPSELSAVGSLSTINTACVTYDATYHIGFPSTLAALGTWGAQSSTSAQLIDNVLARGAKSGYTFTYVAGPASDGAILSYTVNADPITPGKTGTRHFFSDQSGVIRQTYENREANAQDPPRQ